ncbi:alpha/beta fold hydrolase [Nocardiopsis sp. CNT312]|uniref:alpha/beta fold hydrolase n=1 Tax=Nocardiopsis sp. CNT312 TaxID=1137268 RepID=UPI00048B3023|nr:alpha/beta hydrolase [Nocardiopsis sp. CNT312]
MKHPTSDAVRTGTLAVPGATLYYEVRGEGPPVALVGSPMAAGPFAPLADLLAADHTVLTTDPRGIGRSPVEDPARGVPVAVRADDLARLLARLDAGPAAVLGSSGGAVTALALVQDRPELVHTVVAHEAPLEDLLEDREKLHAATEEMVALHGSGDAVGAWRLFMSVAGLDVPEEALEQMFGGERGPGEVADERRFFAFDLRETTRWRPDFEALRSAPVRVVPGIGEDSAGQLCDRTSMALAAGLGVRPAMFPGGHSGFSDAPEPFAARLREVLGEK